MPVKSGHGPEGRMHGQSSTLFSSRRFQGRSRQNGSTGLEIFGHFFSKYKARGSAGVDSQATGGTFDISNADRLGKSETQLVNIFIEGVAQIIRWEQERL